ncbi:MAG: hypothetical protein II477_11100 [Lachnospiraceae bacterium]|nr:hypothetical protein [Lachnospiraceae bacterium]
MGQKGDHAATISRKDNGCHAKAMAVCLSVKPCEQRILDNPVEQQLPKGGPSKAASQNKEEKTCGSGKKPKVTMDLLILPVLVGCHMKENKD